MVVGRMCFGSVGWGGVKSGNGRLWIRVSLVGICIVDACPTALAKGMSSVDDAAAGFANACCPFVNLRLRCRIRLYLNGTWFSDLPTTFNCFSNCRTQDHYFARSRVFTIKQFVISAV